MEMGVKVRLNKGQYYLDIYHKGVRRWESLGIRRTDNAAQNREIDRLAEMCRVKREMQLLAGEYDIIDTAGGKMSLYDYMAAIAAGKGAKNHYAKALRYLAVYPSGREIQLAQINARWLMEWQDWLKRRNISPVTAKHYDDAVRCVLNQAVRERKLLRNPADEIRALPQTQRIMPVLTMDELRRLADAPIPGKLGAEVKRAFLFACWTGLRIGDIRSLRWSNVQDGKIRIVMHKTDRVLEIPIHPMAQMQLGLPGEGSYDNLVFPLVGTTGTNCLPYIERWCARAGVHKVVGWHTARRTFATLAVEAGVDQFVISKLLGHTSIRHTATYSQVPITVKQDAVGKIPNV